MVNQEYAMLILQDDAGQGQHWSLNRSEMYIGRHKDCDIVLDDRKVSRQHARIVRDASGYVLADLNSKNGTYINGEALAGEHRLEDGDEVQIAVSFRLMFVDAGATVPLFFEQTSQRGLSLDREAREVYVNRMTGVAGPFAGAIPPAGTAVRQPGPHRRARRSGKHGVARLSRRGSL